MFVELVVESVPRAVQARPESFLDELVARLVEHMMKYDDGDKAWLLQLLYLFELASEVFGKSYRYFRHRNQV